MDRPSPTGPAAPDLRIVESRVYRGGNFFPHYWPGLGVVSTLAGNMGYTTCGCSPVSDLRKEVIADTS